MKKVSLLLVVLLFTSALFAQNQGTVVQWKTIVGVIKAPFVDNPVAGISAAVFPWRAAGGGVLVDLSSGNVAFQVQGLVLVGTNGIGTPGDLTQLGVLATLVCNAGTPAQAVIDTAPVPLSGQGNAQFAGNLGTLPAPCVNPIFLLRRPNNGLWVAAAAVRVP